MPLPLRNRSSWAGVAVLCGMLGGCASDGLSLLPADSAMPEQLTWLMEHSDNYAQTADNPLADVQAGTAIDDLRRLSGCWAAYSQGCADQGCLSVYEFLDFDSQSGTLTRSTVDELIAADGSPSRMVVVESGSYSVIDEGHIHFEIESIRITTQITVGGFPVAFSVAETPDAPPAYDVNVTLSGESLKTFFVPVPADGGLTIADQLELIHKQVDCP